MNHLTHDWSFCILYRLNFRIFSGDFFFNFTSAGKLKNCTSIVLVMFFARESLALRPGKINFLPWRAAGKLLEFSY